MIERQQQEQQHNWRQEQEQQHNWRQQQEQQYNWRQQKQQHNLRQQQEQQRNSLLTHVEMKSRAQDDVGLMGETDVRSRGEKGAVNEA